MKKSFAVISIFLGDHLPCIRRILRTLDRPKIAAYVFGTTLVSTGRAAAPTGRIAAPTGRDDAPTGRDVAPIGRPLILYLKMLKCSFKC